MTAPAGATPAAATKPKPTRRRRRGPSKKEKEMAAELEALKAKKAPTRRRRRRRTTSTSKKPTDLVGKLDLKSNAIAGAAAYGGLKFVGGKTVMGKIPQSAAIALGISYFVDAEWSKPASYGLAGAAAFEFMLAEAIREGRVGDFLKPFITNILEHGNDVEKANASALQAALAGFATQGTVSHGDGDVMADLLNRHANGG